MATQIRVKQQEGELIEIVQNGGFNEIGSELVIDGDFPTGTGSWNPGTGWSIGGGSANGLAAIGDLQQENVVEFDKYYEVNFTISNYVAGIVRFEMPGNTAPGIDRSANGRYTETILSAGTLIQFDGRTSFTGSIDNVSVKGIGQNWISNNGATFNVGKAIINGDGSSFTNIKQTGVFIDGKTYQVVINVTITSGLGLTFQDGANNENIGFATTTGVYTFDFTGTSNSDLVIGRRTGGTPFESSVNNVSVIEVGTRPITYLDISEEQPLNANLQFKDIQDFKSSKGNHTFNFRLPSTTNNDNFFRQYFNVTQSGNYNPKQKVDATITKDTIDVFNGFLQLVNVYCSNNVTYHYECIVYSSISTLGQVLSGKYLSEFDWSFYNFPITTTNLTKSWAGLLANGNIVYSLYDYGCNLYGGQNGGFNAVDGAINILNLKPQIRFNKIFKDVINQSGFTYTSTFIDTTMNELFMDFNSGGSSINFDVNSDFFNVQASILPTDTPLTFTASNGAMFTLIPQVGNNPDDTNSAGDYNVGNGYYQPQSLWSTTGFYAIGNLNSNAIAYDQIITFVLWNITDDESTGIEYIDTIVAGQTGANFLMMAQAIQLDSTKFYALRVQCEVDPANTTIISWTIPILEMKFTPLQQGTTGYVGFGNSNLSNTGIFEAGLNMPKLKAIDFITSFAKKFNLVIIPDDLQPSHLYIEPYSVWITQGGQHDWTQKLDTSKDVQLTPTVDLQAKSLMFSDAESNDFNNAEFKTSQNRIYGSQFVDNTDNDFGKEKEEITTIFTPVISTLIPSTISTTEILGCVCHDGDGGTSEGIRLSFKNANAGLLNPVFITDATTTSSYFSVPQFSNYKDLVVTSATECLTFAGENTGLLQFAPTSINGSYTNYWKRFLQETYSRDARLLKASFYVSALDILDLSFNDIIFVKNEYFRINKINNYPLVGEGNCDVELIKVNRVKQLDSSNIECDVEPFLIGANGIVLFTNVSTGGLQNVSQSCCEAFGYTFMNGNCYQESNEPNDPSDPLPDTNAPYQIIKGGNNGVSGIFNDVVGNDNSASGHTTIKGNKNKVAIDSIHNTITGNNNVIKNNAKASNIIGDKGIIIPLKQRFDGTYLKTQTTQSWKNLGIFGDFGYGIISGDSLLSGGADPLYNRQGRSQSGHFVKHGFTERTSDYICIGQNGVFESVTGTNSITRDGNNAFQLPYPSQMMFEMTIAGSSRGTSNYRLQDYSFRKYSGVMVNNNNSFRPTISQFSLDTTKETQAFTEYNVYFKFPMPYDETIGGVKQTINSGLFYIDIDVSSSLFTLEDVDWTIDFKYTFQILQNIDVPTGELPFNPKTQITGLLQWLDCADVSSLVHTNGSLSRWADLSGNSHDMISPATINNPTYNQDLSAPAVSFDGTKEFMENSDANLLGISTGANTLFVVFDADNTTTLSNGKLVVGGSFQQSQLFGLNVNKSGGSTELLYNGDFDDTYPINNSLSGWSYIATGSSNAVLLTGSLLKITKSGTSFIFCRALDSSGSPNNIVTINDTYDLTYEVTQVTGTNVVFKAYVGSNFNTIPSTVGTHSVQVTSGSSSTQRFEWYIQTSNSTITLKSASLKLAGGGSPLEISMMCASTAIFTTALANLPTTIKQVVTGTRNLQIRKIYDQTNAFDEDSDASNATISNYQLGATSDGRTLQQLFDGEIYEVLLYDRLLSTLEQNQIENYLQSKWNT